MAVAAPLALAVTAATQVAGGVMQRNSAYKASRVDDENARLAILSGEQDAEAIRREERFRAGELIAGFGGSGLLSDGSAGDLLADSAYQAELDVLRTRQKAFGEARNFKARAKDTRRAGKAALVGGLFSAVSTAVQGAAQLKAQRIESLGGTRVSSTPTTGGYGGSRGRY
jgi:hypothetical protein